MLARPEVVAALAHMKRHGAPGAAERVRAARRLLAEHPPPLQVPRGGIQVGPDVPVYDQYEL